MLKIMILEDEKAQSDRLMQYLSNYRDEHTEFEYVAETYDRGIPFLEAYQCDADLIFLDIRVPDLPGMEVAKRIRQADQNVMIVFVTSLTQYAIEGYSVEAFDYILKPIQYASFSAKLARALRMLSYREPEISLILREKEGESAFLLGQSHMLRSVSTIFCFTPGMARSSNGELSPNMRLC